MYGFNEAPIHESGKCATGRGTQSQARGFNEAPIHESGKSAQVCGWLPGLRKLQ